MDMDNHISGDLPEENIPDCEECEKKDECTVGCLFK